MKTYHFLPVFLILVLSYVGLHFYAGRWLARSFALPPGAAQAVRMTLLLAAFLSPFTMFLKRHYQGPALEWLYTAGYAWMGLILIAALIFAFSDLAALALRRTSWFQQAAFAWLTLVLLAAVAAWSVHGGMRVPDLKPVTAAVKDLPPNLEGFRIVQISDMHLDASWKLRQFAAIVEKINAAKPDLVLITGDLLDPGITCQEDIGALARGIKSRLGVYGCLGNHEYYYGLGAAAACYGTCGIKLLKNASADLGDLSLIGLADIHTEHMTREDVIALLGKLKSGKFTLLMSHQPIFYEDIAATGDYLGLSGHTHRGQIFPFHIFTKLFYKYFYGLYSVKNSVFYVTSGTGTWGPPLRWLAPAEIPLVTLTKR